MNLLFNDLRWFSLDREHHGDFRLGNGRIIESRRHMKPRRLERVAPGEGLLALPGLINAHDHLSLNLLPRLGEPPYTNFYRWAEDIYHPDSPQLQQAQTVDLRDRWWLSAYRNLLAGVTTVVHHDPFPWHLRWRRFPLRILRRYGWAHSLGYGGDVATAKRRSRGRPFILHAAEGIDETAGVEIDRLDELGVLGPSTVLVHGMALSAAQIDRLAATRTGLVWCPASNLWLYGKTAPIAELIDRVPVALGTDSTLSGSAHLLDELRCAATTGLAAPRQLVAMVTTAAARIFRLHDGRGTLEPGAPADLVLLRDRGADAADTLLASRPADVELVVVAGRPRLASPRMAAALGLGKPNLCFEGVERWVVGDPVGLLERIASRVEPRFLGELVLSLLPSSTA